MHRELDGYSKIKMNQFTGKSFPQVLSEIALYAASVEKDFPEYHLVHEWSEDEGHLIYLYEQYS